MADVVLQTQGVTLKYGQFLAVNGVDAKFERNKLHSVIGPNGAGKTSFFNLLSGTLMPTAGKVVLDGQDVSGDAAQRRLHKGLARSFQVTQLFGGLTVYENIRLAAQARDRQAVRQMWRSAQSWPEFGQAAGALVERLGLQRHAHTRVADLSHGQQRLVEVAVCLASRPKVILLDEPTSGMGVDDIPRMMALVKELATDHTVILIEHNMKLVLSLSDHVLVLAQGKLLASGTPAEVRANASVRSVYLGKREC